MNNLSVNHLTSLLQDDVITVGVRFKSGSSVYTYKCHRNHNVQEGDTVIVDSPRDGLVCVEVVRVDDFCDIDVDSSIVYKHVVQRVDVSRYVETLEREEEFMRRIQSMQRQRKIEEALQAAIGDFGGERFDDMVKQLRGCKTVNNDSTERYLSSVGETINEKV